MTLLNAQQRLAEKGYKLFTAADFRRAIGLSRSSAYKALERYAKRGAVVRIRNGLYSLPRAANNPLVVANVLYRPSYVSYETALAHHHLIPEVVYAVTCATTRRTQELEVGEQSYIYHAIKRAAFTGYRGYKLGPDTVMMADPEKALCDYLFLVFLKKRALNDRIDWKKVDRKKLAKYARLFKPKAFAGWVEHALSR